MLFIKQKNKQTKKSKKNKQQESTVVLCSRTHDAPFPALLLSAHTGHRSLLLCAYCTGYPRISSFVTLSQKKVPSRWSHNKNLKPEQPWLKHFGPLCIVLDQAGFQVLLRAHGNISFNRHCHALTKCSKELLSFRKDEPHWSSHTLLWIFQGNCFLGYLERHAETLTFLVMTSSLLWSLKSICILFFTQLRSEWQVLNKAYQHVVI